MSRTVGSLIEVEDVTPLIEVLKLDGFWRKLCVRLKIDAEEVIAESEGARNDSNWASTFLLRTLPSKGTTVGPFLKAAYDCDQHKFDRLVESGLFTGKESNFAQQAPTSALGAQHPTTPSSSASSLSPVSQALEPGSSSGMLLAEVPVHVLATTFINWMPFADVLGVTRDQVTGRAEVTQYNEMAFARVLFSALQADSVWTVKCFAALVHDAGQSAHLRLVPKLDIFVAARPQVQLPTISWNRRVSL